jgi:hypothetical protein
VKENQVKEKIFSMKIQGLAGKPVLWNGIAFPKTTVQDRKCPRLSSRGTKNNSPGRIRKDQKEAMIQTESYKDWYRELRM